MNEKLIAIINNAEMKDEEVLRQVMSLIHPSATSAAAASVSQQDPSKEYKTNEDLDYVSILEHLHKQKRVKIIKYLFEQERAPILWGILGLRPSKDILYMMRQKSSRIGGLALMWMPYWKQHHCNAR